MEQEFLDEYDNIHETLQNLMDDISNKELREEINGFISVLREDYQSQRDECEQYLEEEEEKELGFLNIQYERARL